MLIKSIHPFPARMAPELALSSLNELQPGSTVLDPMSGSGTVLRQALALGHCAIGFDMDPLAVLMSRVWTTPTNDRAIASELASVLEEAADIDLRSTVLPWQQDEETARFVQFWFAPQQRRELSRLAFVLEHRRLACRSATRRAAIDVLRVAMSRIIITKEQCASLARDTSHSRPHRVALESAYDVRLGFERSAHLLRKRLIESPPASGASVSFGDARALTLTDASVDAVLTSPPYLNAIDYMRGHRMSLVWLGHSLTELRGIRSEAIGAERGLHHHKRGEAADRIVSKMCTPSALSGRYPGMVKRYADDLIGMANQIARVLRPGGRATYVVGNSCVKGAFIRNADGVAEAAKLAGMVQVDVRERELPANSRYLPITLGGTLSKRMRTESVLTFRRI